jgi:hypothetical protein
MSSTAWRSKFFTCGLIDLVFATLFSVAFMMTQQRTREAVTAALA